MSIYHTFLSLYKLVTITKKEKKRKKLGSSSTAPFNRLTAERLGGEDDGEAQRRADFRKTLPVQTLEALVDTLPSRKRFGETFGKQASGRR